MSRVANYCPACGTQLQQRPMHGRIRPVCPDCGYIVYFDPKVAVVVMITDEDDAHVLLVQRANEPGMGKWAMPAGFVDYDETPEDAAVREVQEETGLNVDLTRLLAVFPRRDEGLADIVIAYAAQVTSGELIAGDDASDAAWFPRDALPELVFYPSITLVGAWSRGEPIQPHPNP